MDELAGTGAGDELRRVVRLEPLVGQDLATVEQLGAREAHGGRGRPGSWTWVSSAGGQPSGP